MLPKTIHPKAVALPGWALAFVIAACGPAGSVPTDALPVAAATAVAATAQPDAVATAAKLNLNTAAGDDFLAVIPGMNNRMVREFLEYRPYLSIRQFRAEIGKYVGEAQVAQYEQYVYVPIALNDSDAATLQQIPGLEAGEADELIAGRPYASADAFLSRLAGYVSETELAVARTYLSAP
jgi:radical SAM superfamily enzyme with C-terminal helix-hairpin-helix motif